MSFNETQFTNPSFLQKLALDLIKPRRSNYVEDCINYYIHDNKFVLEDINGLKNNYNHTLKATLIKHRVSLFQKIQQDFSQNKNKSLSQQKCIVYLHGLGSNRMQGFSILPHLPKNYSLFTFDLSGSGKSQGQFTSYGFREQQDIQAVLNYLHKSKNYKNFIIWGRSMGAVSSLLFNNRLTEKQTVNSISQQVTKQTDEKYIPLSKLSQFVKCIIADSPFCSFQSISKDIALNKMSVPHFFTQIALKFIQNSFKKILQDKKTGINFTPFQIDFTKNKLKPIVPIVFVYSLNDEIVSCEHSQKIIKSIEKCKEKMVEKIVIPECSHNLKRPQIVIETIFQKIQKFCNIKSQKILYEQTKNKNIKDSYFLTEGEIFQKQTQMVRRKSFWDFQQQFSQNQKHDTTKITQNIDKKNSVAKNAFVNEKMVNEKQTVRRSIFQRKQSNSIINNEASTIKKRGLSLSSTIQRTQSTYNQNNFVRKASVQPHKTIQQKIGKKSPPKNVKKLRQISLDLKSHDKNKNEQNKNQTNKKNNEKYIRDCFDSNFSKTIDSRFSHVNNKNNRNRIYLGGSIEGKRLDSRDVIEKNLQSKNFNRQESKGRFDNENEFKKSNNNLYSSIISEYNQIYDSKLNMREIPSKDTITYIPSNNYFSSEPNIPLNQTQFERVQSRKYLRTIDYGGMSGKVNQNLAKFINNKLQFEFDNFDVVNRVFDKGKTDNNNNKKDNEQNLKSQQNTLLSENGEKFLSLLRENKDVSSNNNVISHSSSFRPSIRLYNEKRRKKVQAQHAMYNKIQQNIEITNQRYLIED